MYTINVAKKRCSYCSQFADIGNYGARFVMTFKLIPPLSNPPSIVLQTRLRENRDPMKPGTC